jgi:hypothetical protein
VQGLVRELDQAGIRYAVLRWFETLPELEPGEDLDVLVADEDLDAFRAILDREPGTIPVDLYSESGLVGSDYHGMAYYPPALAATLLGRTVRHSSGALVPSPVDHLHSLAYHAAYHKGLRSGIPSETRAPVANPEHDYPAALQELARRQGITLPTTLEGVDAYLAERGWRPPPDTLRRLAEHTEHLRDSKGRATPEHPGLHELPELAAFFVREQTLDVLGLAEVEQVLARLEFEIMDVRTLAPDARARCQALVRGGNWGRGPFGRSGGGPVVALVALHYGPRPPDDEVRRRYPALTNSDVLLAKNQVRDLVLSRTGEAQAFNPVHSSDNEAEAWEYIEVAMPENLQFLRQEVAQRKAAFRTDVPVRTVLSLGRRAKVEVVEGADRPVVRKTFGPHALPHFRRELAALQELGPVVPAVPEVCDVGDNWFTLPLFDDQLRLSSTPGHRLVPLRHAREMVSVLRQVHAQGADLIDAKPQNFLLDPRRGLTLVDLEFCHWYDGDPPPFQASYSFAGVPEGFIGDVPYGETSYRARWEPFVGLSLRSLLEDPIWLQHLRRNAFRARLVAGQPRRLARYGRDRVRATGGGLRSALGSRYRRWSRARSGLALPSTASR